MARKITEARVTVLLLTDTEDRFDQIMNQAENLIKSSPGVLKSFVNVDMQVMPSVLGDDEDTEEVWKLWLG